MNSESDIPFSKVLKPTAEEFADFAQFVESLDHDKSLQNYGLIKVIPPPKWKPRKSSFEFDSLVVNAPIEQNVQGKSGIYELLLIQKKSMRLPEYKKKVECFDGVTNNKAVEEVEDMFWKSLTFSPPLYGADMAGTLFDAKVPWNLNDLPGVLKEGLKKPIAGVNHPYLYVGSWKSMFAWHKEDLDLYSINFLHYGKPKFWYCLAPSESHKLENFARSYFPESFNKCKEVLRHKTTMMNPYILQQKIPDLKIYKMVQYPGEFIITVAGGYHTGFNWGFNIAEAVNFATTKWLDVLPNVSSCTCINDSVKIDKAVFFANILSSPLYGKVPHIKKLCNENITKVQADGEEDESTETADSPDTENVKKPRNRTIGKENNKKEKIRKSVKSDSLKRVKTLSKKAKKKFEEPEEEEDEPRQRISNRSKKIKKLGEEFDAPPPVKKKKETKVRKIGRPKKVIS